MTEHKPLTDAELDEIEARAKKATPEPWKPLGGFVAREPIPPSTLERIADFYDDDVTDQCWDNEVFVAHARTDVPALVKDVRRLREAAQQLLNDICVDEPGFWPVQASVDHLARALRGEGGEDV